MEYILFFCSIFFGSMINTLITPIKAFDTIILGYEQKDSCAMGSRQISYPLSVKISSTDFKVTPASTCSDSGTINYYNLIFYCKYTCSIGFRNRVIRVQNNSFVSSMPLRKLSGQIIIQIDLQRIDQAQFFPDKHFLKTEACLTIHPSRCYSSQKRIHSLFITNACFRAVTRINNCLIIKDQQFLFDI